MLTLRVDGLPLEHVLGWAAFRGLRILVDSRVFVPRRRTELLVEETVRIAPRGATVVDLCCGTGAVATALLNELTDARVIAADIDPAAVASARRNLEARGGTVLQGDLFDPLPRELRGTVDVIVANAPYVPTEAIQLMPQEAREHEDIVALDGGEDGLDIQRRVVLGVTEWLRPGGWLIIETSESQSLLTASLFTAVGLSARIVRSEELDATAVVGHLPLD
jgi:release factor glutamine methyltransferase